ncbi:MAG: kelch repeat-containing protein [Blastocatellales bacterium]
MLLSRNSSPQRILRTSAAFLVLLGLGLIAARWQMSGQAQQLSVKNPVVAAAGKPLPFARVLHTATLLPNGKVLVAGGSSDGTDAGASNSAFLYDPSTGNWTETALMKNSRYGHFAVLLQNGKVLIGGGRNGNGFLNTAELFDPATQQWTLTGSMSKARFRASATLLAYASNASGNSRNGFALAVGGQSDASTVLETAELFNPSTGAWIPTGNKLSRPRVAHSMTLLTNGEVLIAGGYSVASQPVNAVDIYDPFTDKWRTTNSLNTARFGHSATLLTNGKVLIAGGISSTGEALSSVEIFDAPNHTWTTELNKMAVARAFHSSSLLPNGSLFVVGGFRALQGGADNTGEIYSPSSKSWSSAGTFGEARGAHTATIMANARVLIVGGAPIGSVSSALSSVEFFDPANGRWLTQGSSPNQLRYAHTATLLANGRVLIAGGRDANGAMKFAEIYDPPTDTWTQTGDMKIARGDHRATLLRNGKVLVTGGIDGGGSVLDSAEVYDPVTGSWSLTNNVMPNKRANHTATLLADGRVLAVGGWNVSFGVNILKGCDIYDPATNSWMTAGSLNDQRRYHTATLLYDGRVLAAGGEPETSLKTSELYDPATNRWTKLASQTHVGHLLHTATLLANGKVLIVSGLQSTSGNPTSYSGSANLFDPVNQRWDSVTSPAGRIFHTATLLPNGKVLIAGGFTIQSSGANGGSFINNVDAAELYDPAKGTSVPFSETTKITFPRDGHTSTLLPNGKVMIVGGRAQVTSSTGTSVETLVDKVELYDVGLDAVPTVAPALTQSSWNGNGTPVCANGIRFQGGGEAAGGNITGSNTNYPVVQLMRVDNQQTFFLSPDANSTKCAFKGWTNNSYASLDVPATTLPGTNNNLLPGIAMMTVFVNGIPSSKATILAPDAPPGAKSGGNVPLVNLSGRIHTLADTGLQANVELRSSTGEVRNVFSGPNGEYIFEDVPTRTPGTTTGNITPSQVTAGSPTTQFIITGSGFTAASIVLFNGQQQQTTFVSSTELRANVPSSLLQIPGYASLVVQTPQADGSTSTTPPQVVQIVASSPSTRPNISSLSPPSATVGANLSSITINGSNLINGSTQVLFNGQSREIISAQSSPTKLVFQPLSSDFSTAGTATVQVKNAGGSSNTVGFPITSLPSPAISNLNPSSVIAGTALNEIAINGANLLNPNGVTQVLWNGQIRSYVANRSSATQIIFLPLSSDLSQPGIATVRVIHRTSANGDIVATSNVVNFTITQVQGPVINLLTPASVTVPIANTGSIADQILTVTGNNFDTNAVVRLNGVSMPTNFINTTRLVTVIKGAVIATQTSLNVSVINPSTNLTSNTVTFPINQTSANTVGSVLAYPLYTSSSSTFGTTNTTISVTNTNQQQGTWVHLLFIEGSTGFAGGSYEFIGANQTRSFLASNYDPSTTGYVIVVAVSSSGCPIAFNFLRGSETTSISILSSGVEPVFVTYSGSVSAIPIRAFSAPACTTQSTTATLNFNGSVYEQFPSQVTVDNAATSSQANDMLYVLNAFGGSALRTGRSSSLTSVSGSVVNSSLAVYPFSDNSTPSQLIRRINSRFPVTNPTFDQIVPAGQTGKITASASPPVFGMTLTRTTSFNFATLMRTVALKTASLTIPVNLFIIGLNGDGDSANSVNQSEAPTNSIGTTVNASDSTGIQASETSFTASPTAIEQQQQPPGSPISYTITPSANIPTGEPIEFQPQSRTVTPDGGGQISFNAIESSVAGNTDNNFCGYTSSGLKIGGTISMPPGFTTEQVPVNLQLTNLKAPSCVLPSTIEDQTDPGVYLVQNVGSKVLGYQGSYLIVPTDNRFQFQSAVDGASNVLVPPLTGASLGWNFQANAVQICPASPTATANGETNAQVCQGQPINLSTPVVQSATYTWILPGGSMLSGRTPTIASATLANSGTYRVQIAVPSCSTVEAMVQVTVNPLPTANAGPDQSLCQSGGGTTGFTLNGSAPNGTTVLWNVIGTTGTANASFLNNNRASLNSVVNVTGTGSVTVQLDVSSPAGCGTTASDTVVLNVTSAPVTTISSLAMVCANSTGNTASVPSAGAGATYNWTISGGTITAGASTNTVTYTAGASGMVMLNVTVGLPGGCNANNSKNIPIQTITVNPTTISEAVSGAPYSQTFTQAGGAGPITWNLTGTLPTGLSFNTSTATLSGTPTQSGNFPITVTATDVNNCPAGRDYNLIVQPPIPTSGLMFYPLAKPIRLLDTRPAGQRPYAAYETPEAKLTGVINGGTTRTQQARVSFDGMTIPSNASAIVGTATVINFPDGGQYTGTGNVTLYPSGNLKPEVSNLNYANNQTISNGFTVGLGGAGTFEIFTYSNVHLVIDVVGYYAAPGAGGLYFHPLPTPIRLLETRSDPIYPGCNTPRAAVNGTTVYSYQGRLTCGGVTIPAGAQALIGNLTSVNGTATPGLATIYSGDLVSPPGITSLVFNSTQAIPNSMVVKLGGDGMFKLNLSNTSDILIDITGYFSAEANDINGQGLLFTQLATPIRLLETRSDPIYPGCYTPRAPLSGGSTRTQLAQVNCGGIIIPSTARAIIGNATAINSISPGSGNVTLYPTQSNKPEVSNLNYVFNQVIPNAFTVGLSNNGEFDIFVFSTIDLLIDVTGYFAP